MQSLPLVRFILRDEAVTRGLGDIEASLIVDWLAGRAERVAENAPSEEYAWQQVHQLCHRARIVGCFVRLWSSPASRGSAMQLVANERLMWPLPQGDIDAGELMEHLLAWLDRQDELVEEASLRRVA